VHYDDPAFPLYLRRNSLSLYTSKRVLCHWHQDFEFFLVEKGHPSYFVNGSTIQLKEGEMLFVNSRFPHYGFSPDGTDSVYLVLVFQPALLAASPLIAESFVDPLRNNRDLPFLVFPAERCLELKKEMLAILEILNKKEEGYTVSVLAHLYAFWSLFLSLKGQERAIVLAPSSKAMLLQHMLTYIYTDYAERITVADIASAASISPGYASHLFSELLHSSPIAYLLSFRIEKSEEMLADFTKNISEISQASGFDSPAYYSEIFRREKGCSPRKYRELFLKEKHN
jgi:AraC-like DNA-binding protein